MARPQRWTELRATGRPQRRLWLTTFGLIALVCVASALARPLLGGPDESAHAIRSAAVARGQLLGETLPGHALEGFAVRVPKTYGRTAAITCQQRLPTPTCHDISTSGRQLVSAATYEIRGPFVYYSVVGLPSLVYSGLRGFYAMRLLSGLICAAFLTQALVIAARTGSFAFLVGVFAAASPEVLVLAGVINTNALEAAASICLWTALLALVRSPTLGRAGLIRVAGAAGTALTLSRGLSPIFMALCLVTVGAITPLVRVRELFARRDVRAWALVLAAASTASLIWSSYVVSRFPLSAPGHGWVAALRRLPNFGRQLVSLSTAHRFGFTAQPVPTPSVVYIIWAFAVVALLVGALRHGALRERVGLAALVVAPFAILVFGDAGAVGGQFWLGRHALAVACGIPLVAGAGATWRRLPSLLMLGALVAAQAIAFVWSLAFYAGRDSTSPLDLFGPLRWTPPLPAFVLVVAYVAGLGGAAFFLARRAATALALQ